MNTGSVRKFTDFLPSAIGGDFTDTILRGLDKLQQKSFSPRTNVVIECFNQNFQFKKKSTEQTCGHNIVAIW
jgi:hypothetical protein